MEKNLIEKFKEEIRSTVVFTSTTLDDIEKENQRFFSMLNNSILEMKNSKVFSIKEIEEVSNFADEYRALAHFQAKDRIVENLRNNWKFF